MLKKFLPKISRSKWVTDSPLTEQNRPTQESSTKTSESIDIQSQNEVALESINYINNSTKCHPSNNQDSLANSTNQNHDTNQIQDAWDSEESISDIAWMLEKIEDAPGLLELKTLTGFTPDRLNQAWRLLDANKRKEIAAWAKQLKAEQECWDFDYLIDQIDRQIKRIGKTVDYWKNYLLEKYNVASRLYLNDEQIIEFWSDLQDLPTIIDIKPAF